MVMMFAFIQTITLRHMRMCGRETTSFRFNLITLEVKHNRGYTMREIRQIRKLTFDNKELLREVWGDLHEAGAGPE